MPFQKYLSTLAYILGFYTTKHSFFITERYFPFMNFMFERLFNCNVQSHENVFLCNKYRCFYKVYFLWSVSDRIVVTSHKQRSNFIWVQTRLKTLKMLFRSKTAIQTELARQWLEFKSLKISALLHYSAAKYKQSQQWIHCWEMATMLSNEYQYRHLAAKLATKSKYRHKKSLVRPR